jgi:hypothetical protein
MDFLAVDLSVKTNNLILSLVDRSGFGYVMNVIFDKFSVLSLFLVSIGFVFLGSILIFFISHYLSRILISEYRGVDKIKNSISIKMIMLFVLMFLITPNMNVLTNNITEVLYSSHIGKFVNTIIETVIEVLTNEFFYENIKIIENLLIEIPLVVLMIPTFILFYKVSHKTAVYLYDRWFNKVC